MQKDDSILRRPDFRIWLKKQAHRDDPVGDLAQDTARARRHPRVSELHPMVQAAVRQAFDEFKQ